MTEYPLGRRQRPPSHPGALLSELIENAGLKKSDAARMLGISRQHLHDLTRERKPVSPTIAIRLGKMFGDDGGPWLRMQAAFDLWHAAREVDVSGIPVVSAA